MLVSYAEMYVTLCTLYALDISLEARHNIVWRSVCGT